MKTLIVIPAFNEATNLARLLPELVATVSFDVVIINDASTDETAQVAKAHDVACFTLPIQLGAWGATQTGIRYAAKTGYSAVITMDADGQHLPNELNALMRVYNNTNANVVIGTFPSRLSRLKKLAWKFFKMLTHIKIEDLTSGFRLYDKAAIEVLSSKQASMLDYQDVGVLLLLLRAGLTINEVPVKMEDRNDGKSRVFSSWLVVLKYMVQTTTLCVANIGKRPTQ
ncbi:glycosyltransferase family 2 protein [Marinicella sp. S1101]|uniref:glycosyltransferase family 2 protein n=1 Tax=Marinicella marina TaxID=2996016 RepID=UPI0022608DE6|nr:glycosyltransferase family 2 protein [Marinicella marina]MCX7553949.1 glycosyltransferase family 2 protein [Marinicella marina]